MSISIRFSVVLCGLCLSSFGGCIVLGDFGADAVNGGGNGGAGGGGSVTASAGVGTGGAGGAPGDWSRRYGDTSHQRGNAAAILSNGDIIVGGEFAGELDLGSGHLQTVTPTELKAFAARIGANGAPMWLSKLTETTEARVSTVAIAGPSVDEVVFAGGQQRSGMVMGAFNAALWKISAVDQKSLWDKPYVIVSDAEDNVVSVSTDPTGNAYMAVSIGENATLGTCAEAGDVSWPTGKKLALVKVGGETSPMCAWARGFDATKAAPVDVAVDGTGKSYLSAWFAGSITPPMGPGLSTGGPDDYATALIVMQDGIAAPVFSKKYAGKFTGDSFTATAMAMDWANARIYLVGSLKGTFEDGTTSITAMPGDVDAFVLALGLDGAVMWVKRIGGSAVQVAFSVAAAADGVYISGTSKGPMAGGLDSDTDFACIGGTKCGFVMHLDANGNFGSLNIYGNDEPGTDAVLRLAAAKSQHVIVGGWSEPIDFGQGPLSGLAGPANQDVVLARFLVAP